MVLREIAVAAKLQLRKSASDAWRIFGLVSFKVSAVGPLHGPCLTSLCPNQMLLLVHKQLRSTTFTSVAIDRASSCCLELDWEGPSDHVVGLELGCLKRFELPLRRQSLKTQKLRNQLKR